MADFQERIARARIRVEAIPAATLHQDALGVIVSKQTGQYTHYTAAFANSTTIPQLPRIPGASLPAGTKWLVYAGASIGSGDTAADGMVQVFATTGSGGDFARGWAECLSHGTPEAMRGSFIAKWFVYTSDGTDLLWAISNTQGNSQPQPDGNPEGVMIQGAIFIAIPLDDFTRNQVNGDYWNAAPEIFSGNPELSTTSPSLAPILTTTYEVTEPGDYLILACTECNIANAQGAKARLKVDGSYRNGEWWKFSADSRDVHSFSEHDVITLDTGVHTISIDGASRVGLGNKVFTRSSIVILKLAAFGSYAVARDDGVFSVTTPYPEDESILSVTYTPYVAGEYVLVIGGGGAQRLHAAGLAIRLHDDTLSLPLGQEFCGMAHPGEGSGGAEVPSFMAAGAELANSAHTYSLRGMVEVGYASPMAGITSWPMMMIALGLTKRIGPQTIVISGSETVGVAETSTQPLDGAWLVGSEEVSVSEQSQMVATVPGPSLPTTHPRLWLHNTERLAYWQAQAAGNTADWQNFLDGREYGDRPWHYLFRYIATGSTTYRDQCIAALQAERASRPIYSGNLQTNQWQEARGYMRSWALIYDWLYNDPALTPDLKEYLEDSLLAVVYVLYHDNHDSVARTIYPGGSSTNAYDEGVNNPDQNFSSTYHFCVMYAAAALWPNKTTFRTIPGDNTSPIAQFQIQFNFKTPGQGPKEWYSDLLEFVRDRLDYKLYPAWQQNFVGGGWSEGSAYGIGVGLFQGEVQALFQAFNWPDTVNPLNSFYRDVFKYHVYQSQPRNRVTIGYGESAGSSPVPGVANFMRHSILNVAYIYHDAYAQWWLDNVLAAMGSSETNEERSFDVFLGRRGQVATDYRNELPTHYHARGTGFFNSRSSWADTATSVTLRCGILIQNHACEDINHLMLFKDVTGASSARNGYILCDPAHFFGSGQKVDHVQYHNTYMLMESTLGALYGWRQRFTDYAPAITPDANRNYGNATFAYVKGDAKDVFWQIKNPPGVHGGSITAQINDVFQREVFHLKAGSYVVVYDRMRVLSAFARPDTNARMAFHWSNSQPVDVGSGVRRHDSAAGARTYQKMFNAGATVWTDVGTAIGTQVPVWQQRVDHLMPTGYTWECTVFEVCDNPAKGAMTQLDFIDHAAPAPINGTMDGVTIRETVRKHILFSAEQDGTTPATIQYAVLKFDNTDEHYVCNMKPNQEYLVTETDLGGGYFRYTLAETFNTGFLANSGGVLVFSPSQIGGQTTVQMTGSEVVGAPVETSTITETHSLTAEGSEVVGAPVETSDFAFGGGDATLIAGGEVVGAPVETVSYGINIVGNETAVVEESSQMVSEGPSPVYFGEKFITPNTLIMVPASDLGDQYVVPEPSNGVLWDKMADANSLTFVRFGPGTIVALSDLFVGLTPPGPFTGHANAVRITAYFRKASISGVSNPLAVFNIYTGSANSTSLLQYNMGLVHVDEAEPKTISSGWLGLNISREKLGQMILRTRMRGSSYTTSFQVDLYFVTVEIRGPTSEKVIS